MELPTINCEHQDLYTIKWTIDIMNMHNILHNEKITNANKMEPKIKVNIIVIHMFQILGPVLPPKA